MVANGLDNLRSEYIVLYDPAYEEEIESRLREEYLESSLLGKGGVIIKALGHAAAKRYRYAKARYQVGMYGAVGINHKESEDALTIPMFSVATKVVLGSLAKGYQWTKSLKARSKKISTFAKGTSNLNPNKIRFSQSSVNDSQEIIESMMESGWKGDPIDVVRMPDGGLTTIDNTRVVAARAAGIDVKAVVHNADDLLPKNLVERFTTKKGIPTTWREAIELRIGKQKSSFRNNNPFGSFEMERIK